MKSLLKRSVKMLPCPVCDTQGKLPDQKTGKIRTCYACLGSGWYQTFVFKHK